MMQPQDELRTTTTHISNVCVDEEEVPRVRRVSGSHLSIGRHGDAAQKNTMFDRVYVLGEKCFRISSSSFWLFFF